MKRTILITMAISGLCLFGCTDEKCSPGPWRTDCLCTHEYRPVCGCDGQTYGNACVAGCQGIPEFTEGECGD